MEEVVKDLVTLGLICEPAIAQGFAPAGGLVAWGMEDFLGCLLLPLSGAGWDAFVEMARACSGLMTSCVERNAGRAVAEDPSRAGIGVARGLLVVVAVVFVVVTYLSRAPTGMSAFFARGFLACL